MRGQEYFGGVWSLLWGGWDISEVSENGGGGGVGP